MLELFTDDTANLVANIVAALVAVFGVGAGASVTPTAATAQRVANAAYTVAKWVIKVVEMAAPGVPNRE